MYYFNSNLIARLPYLLKMKKTELYALLGTRNETFGKWTRGDMTADSLVKVANTLRISIADFLVVTERPEEFPLKSDYVFNPQDWTPVEWHPECIAGIFGENGLTGVSKTEAARKLGLSSYQRFDYWASSPSPLRMADLVNMMNAYQLDATLFFHDSNKPIRLPVWEEGGKHLAEIANARMEKSREMERKVVELDRNIRALTARNDRLAKENRLLQEKLDSQPSSASSRMPWVQAGYAFHEKLWESLPDIFGMQKQEFCELAGIGKSSYSLSRNVRVDVLVRVCNLLRMSIMHFFPSKSDILVVHDRSYYEMSERLFVPIEDRMDNMKYLFGRYSVIGSSSDDLARQCGVKPRGFKSMTENGDRSRVLTLVDVCTQFGIHPSAFFKDDNRKRPSFAESRNRVLLDNAMEMMREIDELRETVRRLKARKETTE